MRGPRLLTLAFALAIAFALAAVPVVRTQAAQQDDPVAGLDGGTLYAYDSGAEDFFTRTYFYDTGTTPAARSSRLMFSSPRVWPKRQSPGWASSRTAR
jgi:hypothetical protein